MASYRLQRYGSTTAVEGDLVLEKSLGRDIAPDSALPTAEDSTACSTEKCGNEDDAVNASGLSLDRGADKRSVRVVGSQDIREGTCTLRDVVLPLPGHNARYPTNEVGRR